MVNSVILVGRLTRDPELRYTPNGNPVARFSLAVDRSFRGPNGERQTDFIRCSCWNKTAELVSNYLQKGRLVAIEGSLRVNSVTNADGSRRDYTEVICSRVTFLDRGRDGSGTSSPEESDFADFGEVVTAPQVRTNAVVIEDDDDDVPFN